MLGTVRHALHVLAMESWTYQHWDLTLIQRWRNYHSYGHCLWLLEMENRNDHSRKLIVCRWATLGESYALSCIIMQEIPQIPDNSCAANKSDASGTLWGTLRLDWCFGTAVSQYASTSKKDMRGKRAVNRRRKPHYTCLQAISQKHNTPPRARRIPRKTTKPKLEPEAVSEKSNLPPF